MLLTERPVHNRLALSGGRTDRIFTWTSLSLCIYIWSMEFHACQHNFRFRKERLPSCPNYKVRVAKNTRRHTTRLFCFFFRALLIFFIDVINCLMQTCLYQLSDANVSLSTDSNVSLSNAWLKCVSMNCLIQICVHKLFHSNVCL